MLLVVHNGDGAHRFLGWQSPGLGLECGRAEAPDNPSPATDASSSGDNRESNTPQEHVAGIIRCYTVEAIASLTGYLYLVEAASAL